MYIYLYISISNKTLIFPPGTNTKRDSRYQTRYKPEYTAFLVTMDLLQDISQKLVFPVDFQAQRKLDRFSTLALYTAVIFSCLLAYVTQSLRTGIITFLGAMALMMLATLPAWPAYNKNKPTWVSTIPVVDL